MNIGIDLRCLQTSPRTGVGEYAFELVSEILKQDRTNRYFLFFNGLGKINIPAFGGANVTIARFHYPNKLLSLCSFLFKYPKLDWLIARAFKLEKIDLFFSPHLNFTTLSSKTKHILTIHDLTFEFFPQYLTLKQRLWHRLTNARGQCQNASMVLCPSQNTKRDLVDYFKMSTEKVIALYPGLSPHFKISTEGSGPKEQYILYLGTVEPRKNIGSLVSAFESAASENPKYQLVIAGVLGWKNKKLKKQIAASPVSDRIHLTGYVFEEKKPDLYRRASIFVYPSFYEGFGFPVVEAMASGVPVITSNRSSLPEISDGAAYLVNPNRPEELASAITRIIRDSDLQKVMVNKGLAVARRYTWEDAAKTVIQVMNKGLN